MGFFNWSASLFHRWGDRWDADDAEAIAALLRPHVTEGGRILDLGGGTGALAAHLADALGRPVTVLDPTPEMIAYVPDRADVKAVLGTAEAMPFDADAFDAVVVSDAFHHFRDQDRAVREIQRVVRCGGGVLFLEFDPRGLMRLVVSAEKLLGEPGSFFTPDEMCAFMAERGIEGECEATRGVNYRFLGTVREPATA
jgi:ubiquinone/menaquinone biosynthesis C-methylase UbiE